MAAVNTPIVNRPNLYIDGLNINFISGGSIQISPGSARDSTNEADMFVSTNTLIGSGTKGIGGLDNGLLAPSTWYAIYLVGDSTKNIRSRAIISTSNILPSLPGNCDIYRRIGWCRTDANSSPNFVKMYVMGSSKVRYYAYDNPPTALLNGNANTFTAVDVSASVPNVSTYGTLVNFDTTYLPVAAGNVASLTIANTSSYTNRIGSGVAAAQASTIQAPVVGQTIRYKVTSASDSLSLVTLGFYDYL